MDRYLLELTPETRTRLERLRSYPEEPYDLLLNRLIDSYESGDRLTREEIGEVREALRRLREGGLFSPGEKPAPGQETSPAPIGDPQAVKDMERIFSGAAEKIPDPGPPDTDPGDIHEVDPFDKRGRARTPHLDSL